MLHLLSEFVKKRLYLKKAIWKNPTLAINTTKKTKKLDDKSIEEPAGINKVSKSSKLTWSIASSIEAHSHSENRSKVDLFGRSHGKMHFGPQKPWESESFSSPKDLRKINSQNEGTVGSHGGNLKWQSFKD